MTNRQTAKNQLPKALELTAPFELELTTIRAPEELPFAASDKSLEPENEPDNRYALHLSGVSRRCSTSAVG